MPTAATKPIIFISYAHADEPEKPAEGEIKWLSFVTGYLRPAVKHGAVEIWIDTLMRGGDDWDPEIERKLRACDIFILLVSRHSLSSEYIVDREIAIIRERQGNAEDVRFYPLLLTPTPEIALNVVRDKNLRPRGARPFSSYSLHDRLQHMADAVDEIVKIAQEIAARKNATPTSALSTPLAAPSDRVRQNGQSSAAVRLVLGAGAPFETVEKAGANRRRVVRVKISNDSNQQVANCKLDVVNLDPPSAGTSECALKTDIMIGPKSELFVAVARYDIGSSQALPGNHIRLIVPFIGGFFAEAYAYANLPLVRHRFRLRLSRVPEVYDEIPCVLDLDPSGALTLERWDASSSGGVRKHPD